MAHRSHNRSLPRRVVTMVAALALAGLLGGCVVYPAGGYYSGGYYYGGGYDHHHHWDHDDWR